MLRGGRSAMDLRDVTKGLDDNLRNAGALNDVRPSYLRKALNAMRELEDEYLRVAEEVYVANIESIDASVGAKLPAYYLATQLQVSITKLVNAGLTSTRTESGLLLIGEQDARRWVATYGLEALQGEHDRKWMFDGKGAEDAT